MSKRNNNNVGSAPPQIDEDRENGYANQPVSAPPAWDFAIKNDLQFLQAVRTLRGSAEWHVQAWASWLIIFALTLYGFSTIEAKNDDYQRMLLYLLVVYSCYSAVNLSSIVRDRTEAINIQHYNKYAPNKQNDELISVLTGNAYKYYMNWGVFALTLCALLYMFNNLGDGHDGRMKRFFVAGSVLSLIAQSFNLAKTVRDAQDSKKFGAQYKFSTSNMNLEL
jgi:hypothetical protein